MVTCSYCLQDCGGCCNGVYLLKHLAVIRQPCLGAAYWLAQQYGPIQEIWEKIPTWHWRFWIQETLKPSKPGSPERRKLVICFADVLGTTLPDRKVPFIRQAIYENRDFYIQQMLEAQEFLSIIHMFSFYPGSNAIVLKHYPNPPDLELT